MIFSFTSNLSISKFVKIPFPTMQCLHRCPGQMFSLQTFRRLSQFSKMILQLNNVIKVLPTLSRSVGVPQWKVLVTSVVPSLSNEIIKRNTLTAMSHVKHKFTFKTRIDFFDQSLFFFFFFLNLCSCSIHNSVCKQRKVLMNNRCLYIICIHRYYL